MPPEPEIPVPVPALPAPAPPRPVGHPVFRAILYLVVFVLLQGAAGVVVYLASLGFGLDLTVPGEPGSMRAEGLLLVFAVTAPPLVLATALLAHFLDRRNLASLGARWPVGGPPAALRQALTVPLATLAFLGAWFGLLLLLPAASVRLGGLSEDFRTGLPWWPEGLPPVLLLGLFLLGFLIQGGVEEWVMRGAIYHVLKERWSPLTAAVASSVLFSLFHAFNPDVSGLALANVVLAGVVLAALVERSGSLWSAVIAHGVWNFAVACLLSVPVSGIRTFHLLDLSLAGPEWLTGGGFGPEGSFLLTVIGLALAAWLWRPSARRSLPGDGLSTPEDEKERFFAESPGKEG